MVTDLLERPVDDLCRADTDGPVHLFCCDDDVAMCGADVSGETEVTGTPEEDCCEVCVNKQRLDLPCPDLECPYRRAS